MATTTLSLISDRMPAGMAFLNGVSSNVDGDADEYFVVPSTFGDCLVYSDEVLITGITTLVANPELLGVRRYIGQVVSGSLLGVVGITRWRTMSAGTSIGTSLELPRPQLLRAGEIYAIQYEEADTAATPTGDLRLTLYVQRLRAP